MNSIIDGWFGESGVMSPGFETEAKAEAEFLEFYADDEHKGCFVYELPEKTMTDHRWVIAY